MCFRLFQSRGQSSSLMVVLFLQTLIKAAIAWYFTLDTHETQIWKEEVKAFITQYKYNQKLDVTVRDLETIKYEHKESFAEFLSYWRNKAVKMLQKPSKKELVRIVIKNLQSMYQEKLMF